jgi:hypothetical protein
MAALGLDVDIRVVASAINLGLSHMLGIARCWQSIVHHMQDSVFLILQAIPNHPRKFPPRKLRGNGLRQRYWLRRGRKEHFAQFQKHLFSLLFERGVCPFGEIEAAVDDGKCGRLDARVEATCSMFD